MRGISFLVDSRPTRKALLGVFLAALAIRCITPLCVVGELSDPSLGHWHFGYETGRIASSVAAGRGFTDPLFGHSGPSAWLAPVYPLILAGIFKLLGIYSTASAVAILVFNSIVSSLTCIPLFFIGRKFCGNRLAIAMAWVWALFPYSIFFAAFWVWETCLTTLLLTTLLWLTLEFDRPRPLRAWAGYGALWGLAVLTNPVVLAAFPFLAGWMAYRNQRSGRNWMLRATTMALVCLMTVAPWLVRNYGTFHQPVFIKDNFWLEVAVGNSEGQLHWWNGNAHPSTNPAEMRDLQRLGEVAFMAEKKNQALDFIRHHSALYLWLCFRRFIYIWFGFWSLRLDYLVSEPFDLVNMLFCSALSLAAFLGLRRAFLARNEWAFPCAATLLSVPVIHYLTHPFLTYRHPVDPEILLFATYATLPRLSVAWANWERRARLEMWFRKLRPETLPAWADLGFRRPLITRPAFDVETSSLNQTQANAQSPELEAND